MGTKCWSCQDVKPIVHKVKWQDLDTLKEYIVLVCCHCVLTGLTPMDGGCKECLKA